MYLKRIEYLKSQGSLFKELFYQLNTFYYLKSAKERIEDNQPSIQSSIDELFIGQLSESSIVYNSLNKTRTIFKESIAYSSKTNYSKTHQMPTCIWRPTSIRRFTGIWRPVGIQRLSGIWIFASIWRFTSLRRFGSAGIRRLAGVRWVPVRMLV